jgi:hypothetical protein
MSWRGPGKRARGRRGDQDADLDSTAWLEELEKAAVEQDDQDDQEEEWASKLRRRRSRSRSQEPEPPPRAPDPPGRAPELPRAPVAHDLSPYPPLGGEPPPPPPSGPAREPDYRLLGMEPDTPRRGGDWDAGWDTGSAAREGAAADWTTRDPSPGAAGAGGDPGTDWPTWTPEGSGEPRGGAPVGWEGSGEPRGSGGFGEPQEGPPMERPPVDWEGSGGPQGGPTNERAPVDWEGSDPGWQPAGPDAATGTWSPAEPVDREPDYPALFGELNRRKAAQREALWDGAPAPEPYEEPASPDPPAPTWPFEDTTGSWEPSDRSFIWPAEELPAGTGDWEPSTPSWLDEPAAQPPTWQAAPADTATPGPPPAPPDDWAAGIQSGVPPASPAGRAGDAATRAWRPDEAVGAEPAVPLGADGMPPQRSVADQIQMTEPADHWEPYERPRSRWPKVVAIVSWIVLLMVVCWFYVFPWLERVLPENF